MTTSPQTPTAVAATPDLLGRTVDLLVVGAGVVGLAHAVEAHLRGLSVAVIERDDHAVGASVRNFGHLCVTPQAGRALDYAMVARERWVGLAAKAGFPLLECGTVVAARAEDELAVLEEFADERGSDQVRLLDAAQVRRRVPLGDGVLGGALLPLDLRTDPRAATPALAAWLTDQGVPIHWRTSLLTVEPGTALTTRGTVHARRTVVCVGHDVDRLLPDVADDAGIRRCRLSMLEVAAPGGARVEPAVLTGTSMLRYAGLAASPSSARLRERLASESPELLDLGLNLMFTQRPDGAIVLGDTHHYALNHDPFEDEAALDVVLREGARLLGVAGLTVLRRWRGVYASSESSQFLHREVHDGVHVVSVTSGIGMTTSHGLAADVLDQL